MKNIFYFLVALAMVISCKKDENSSYGIYSPYGNLQPVVDAFEGDETITCKMKSSLDFDETKYTVLSGLKNSHLYFQALDMDKQEVAKTFESKAKFNPIVSIDVGYGETVTKEILGIKPVQYMKTPTGFITSWSANAKDLSELIIFSLFVTEGEEKYTEFELENLSQMKHFIPWINSILYLPLEGQPKCYSYSGEVNYIINLRDYEFKFLLDTDTVTDVYMALSEKEVVRFQVEFGYNVNSGYDACIFHIIKLNLETGEKFEQIIRENVSDKTNSPKATLEIKPGANDVWTFNAVVTEYSGETKNYAFEINLNEIGE